MAISVAQVRQAVAAQVATLSGYHEAKLPPQYFGRLQDTIAHKAFAVEITRSTAVPERQRRSVGLYLNTYLTVRFAYRLRNMDTYPTDYDLSMDQAAQVLDKVLQSYSGIRQGLTGKFDSMTHRIPEGIEYIIHELNFNFLHTIN